MVLAQHLEGIAWEMQLIEGRVDPKSYQTDYQVHVDWFDNNRNYKDYEL
jgi:hypothetical protein